MGIDAVGGAGQQGAVFPPLLDANELLGGFYTYSGKFDYYRANNLKSYPLKDAALIRSAIIDAADSVGLSDWQSIQLSDRTVLLSTASFRDTVIAAVIDPSKQSYSGLDEDGYIFSVLPNGDPYSDSWPFSHIPVTESETEFPDASLCF